MDNEDISDVLHKEEIPRPLSGEDASFSKWQLDPDEFLDVMANLFRGKVADDDGNWVLSENSNPRMNEKGVQDIISSLRLGIFQRFTPLSILEEKVIKRMCYIRGHVLGNLLTAKYKEYGIDPRDILTIHDDIMTAVYVYLARAKDGQTLHGIQKYYKVFERFGESGKDTSDSVVGTFFSKSKGGK